MGPDRNAAPGRFRCPQHKGKTTLGAAAVPAPQSAAAGGARRICTPCRAAGRRTATEAEALRFGQRRQDTRGSGRMVSAKEWPGEKKTLFGNIFIRIFCKSGKSNYLCHANGGLAQLARALAWHARGHEFESRILHQETTQKIANPCKFVIYRDFYFGRNAEKGIEKRVTCGLFGVLFSGPKKHTELLVTDWFASICSGLPLDMRHLGN